LSTRSGFESLSGTCFFTSPLLALSQKVSIATAARANTTSEALVVFESRPIGVSTSRRPSRITTSMLMPMLSTNFVSGVVPFQKKSLTTAKPGMKNMNGIPKA
jgi:hypothetical protein